MSVLALIPARAGSKGIPGKNIRKLAGKPLVAYACECGLGCKQVDRTVVSTECWRIAGIARSYGAETPFLRPASLAGDASPTIDTVRHTLDWFAEHERWYPEIVVLLQPTSPLRTSADVEMALTTLAKSGADSVASVCPVPAHNHPEWQFTIDGCELRTCSGLPLSLVPPRRQSLTPTYTRNGAIYAFRRSAWEATGSIYGQRCAAMVMPTERSVNIDTPADWAAAEFHLRSWEPRREAS